MIVLRSAVRAAAAFFVFNALMLASPAEPNPEPFPQPSNKKGLQVQMIDDAIALAVQHAALNVDVNRFLDLEAKPDSLRWTVDGRAFAFHHDVVERLDRQIKPLSDAGMVIYLILVARESGDPARDAIMLHPRYDRTARTNRISALNAETPDGRAYLRALVEFLAARYSDPAAPQGRVWGWIVGNEVNSHWWWNNMGRAPMDEVASDYEHAVRLVHDAVRSASAQGRVYLSLDHHWTIRFPAGAADQSLPGRQLLETFARFARERGDFGWNLAYHPYPENLGNPRFWDDTSAIQSPDTPRITFKNLSVLTEFMKRPELVWKGKPRRVILSEQGFHCREERPDGEEEQAAAFAAAWWKVSHLDGIDAFILHRHVDHKNEGLNLGLWTRKPDSISTPDRPRKMYEVFKVAGTPEFEQVAAFALPIVRVETWEDLK
ncbi:MAG: DUF5722 domain-containing protein [Chthoniobacteraceae bacterium]